MIMNNFISTFFQRLLVSFFFCALLTNCGGSSSSFNDQEFTPVTIEPIIDGGEGGDEGGSNGEATIGDNLSEEELALLPQIDIPLRKFTDPGSLVILNALVSAQNGADIIATRWEQVSGPDIEISNPNRLNTSVLVPAVTDETLFTFRLIAQDSEGRVNAANTFVVVQIIENPITVIGGIANEGDDSITITIALDGVSTTDTLIDYITFDGTATSDLDYINTASSIIIPAGQSQITVDVPLLNGDLYFDAESFSFQATILLEDGTRARSLATVLIRNANPTPVIDAPALQNIEIQEFNANEPVDGVLFENANENGDRILACISNITLPPGLRLEISELGASCFISGTPITSTEATEYIITAINPAGQSSATITIEVEAGGNGLEAPEFNVLAPLSLQLGQILSPINTLASAGGEDSTAQIISCSVTPELPNGLSFEINDDEDNCDLNGTTTQLAALQTYTLTAENFTANSSFDLSLEVIDPQLSPEILTLSYDLNVSNQLALSIGFAAGSVVVDWNDGSTPISYNAPTTNTITSPVLTDEQSVVTLTFSQGVTSVEELWVSNDFSFNLSVLEPLLNLSVLDAPDANLSGELSRLSQLNTLAMLNLGGTLDQVITGDLADLPQSIERLFLGPLIPITGNLSDLGGNIESVEIITATDSLGITGDFSSLTNQTNLTRFILTDQRSSISGDIADLPNSLTNFELIGFQSFLSGDIADLPELMTRFVLNSGANNNGLNSISGDIQSLPSTIEELFVSGGENTITGDIQNLPASIRILTLSDQNTIFGDIANAPEFTSLNIAGSNTIGGDISGLSNNALLTNLTIEGMNTLTGPIQSLPENLSNITIAGNNTIFGDLGLLKNNDISRLEILGFNTIDTFNVNATWSPTNRVTILILGNGESGFDAENLDQLFNHLAFTLASTNSGLLSFARPIDAAPTTNSLLARTAIENLGYTIFINDPIDNGPLLESPLEPLTLFVGEFGGVELSYSGPIGSCEPTGDFPQGLDASTASTEALNVCDVFGSPTEASEATDYTIEVTFGNGDTLESIETIVNITVLEAIEPAVAPIINSAFDSVSYSEGVEINQVVFSNTGGEVSSCSSSSLPAGLSFSIFEQASGVFTCALSGTPTAALETAEYTLIFVSSFEPINVPLTITVEAALLAPSLGDLPPQIVFFTEGNTGLQSFEEIVFINTGDGNLISCTSVPDINTTTEFVLAPSTDNSTCIISRNDIFTGFEEQSFIITASNATGSDTTTITMAVNSPLLVPPSFES